MEVRQVGGTCVALFDEAVAGTAERHQACNLGGMDIGDGPGQHTMRYLSPALWTGVQVSVR